MLQEVGVLFRTVGHKPYLHLGPEDEIVSVNITPDRCWIVLRRARIQERKYGYVVTHRGVQTILFNRTGPDMWKRDQHTILTPLPCPERHTARTGITPAEDASQREWEDMCHRPGTAQSPLDNLARQAQGY